MTSSKSLIAASAVALLFAGGVCAQSPAPLEEIRNYTWVSDQLASAGQIGNDQIPLLIDEGYEVVVNLAAANRSRNGEEGFLVAESGLTYVHIPVDWENPQLSDVETFFDVMAAIEGRKIFVHCFANMRASAFVYLYRTLVGGVPEAEARAVMDQVWDPAEYEQWGALVEGVKAAHGGR